jgi:putative Mg2+ transporter-C (MgtC) family protein
VRDIHAGSAEEAARRFSQGILLSMHTIAEFTDPNSVMMLKLFIAMLLGGIIGTERAVLARQPAGTRTFGLVALGACLFVIIGNYVNTALSGVFDIQPTYMAAAIITGIGFLGAGIIVFRGDALHGITTAAGLWFTAALGSAVGFGLYSVSVFATLLSLIMFTGMWYLENKFKSWFTERAAEHARPEQPQMPAR